MRFHVGPVEEVEDEVLETVRALSLDCLSGVELVLSELALAEPSLEGRCGLLADRFEIFAVRLPGCAAARLAIAVDLGRPERPRIVLAAVPALSRRCETARRLATRHLRLIDPSWEPQT